MTRQTFVLPAGRQILYIGSAYRDLNAFPPAIQVEIADAIAVAIMGGTHEAAKPWKGLGPGVYEIAVNVGDAYRTVYTVQFREAVYVLHAFQKKSKHGIKTPQREIELVRNRLKAAIRDHEVRYGGKKQA